MKFIKDKSKLSYFRIQKLDLILVSKKLLKIHKLINNKMEKFTHQIIESQIVKIKRVIKKSKKVNVICNKT